MISDSLAGEFCCRWSHHSHLSLSRRLKEKIQDPCHSSSVFKGARSPYPPIRLPSRLAMAEPTPPLPDHAQNTPPDGGGRQERPFVFLLTPPLSATSLQRVRSQILSAVSPTHRLCV